MVKKYYRSDYSRRQWKALIDKATELCCQITYNKYGDIAEIDSTEQESRLIAAFGKDEQDRDTLAEYVHDALQASTILGLWRVQPEIYHRGYSPITYIGKSKESAECEREHLERITGFKWTITQL